MEGNGSIELRISWVKGVWYVNKYKDGVFVETLEFPTWEEAASRLLEARAEMMKEEE